MKAPVLYALIVALSCGLAIGTQSTLTNWAGRLLGPARTGLLLNFAGGVIAGVFLLALSRRLPPLPATVNMASTVPLVAVAGGLGLGIIAGIAFSLPKIGIAAGLASIIFGQMLVAVVVDTLGWGGAPPIPLRLERLLGLGFLLIGAWLVLPRS